MTVPRLTSDLPGEGSSLPQKDRESVNQTQTTSLKIKSTKLAANYCITFLYCASSMIFIAEFFTSSRNYNNDHNEQQTPIHRHQNQPTLTTTNGDHLGKIYLGPILFANGHVVLTKDDQGQSLVLTGEDGKKEDGGDQLVIAGHNTGGGGQDSRMIMQDASNREGDVVINGRSMIIPGEDGHIVLADSRRDDSGSHQHHHQYQPPNPFMFWAPYMSSRAMYRMMPFFG